MKNTNKKVVRKTFIESTGATCKNWQWSWSFINHERKEVLFGVSYEHEIGEQQLILSPEWQLNKLERPNNGYGQALEHITYIESNGYRLRTYRQSEVRHNPITGAVKIAFIDPFLEDRLLLKKGDGWYAVLKAYPQDLTEVVHQQRSFLIEGQRTQITSEAVERNAEARRRCLEKYKLECAVCEFDFFKVFGEAGKDFIHVHHLKPLSQSNGPRIVDPEKDLVPVCPNCHAIIHRGPNLRSIAEMKVLIKRTRDAGDSDGKKPQ